MSQDSPPPSVRSQESQVQSDADLFEDENENAVVEDEENEEVVNEDGIGELLGDDDQQIDDEEEGENLFGDGMERDYQPQPELDTYSESGLDDATEFTEMSMRARRAAERAMNERDNVNLEDDLFYDKGDTEEREKRKKRRESEFIREVNMMDDEELPIDILENLRGRTTRAHVSDAAVAREIERRFRNFLHSFKDPETDKPKYMDMIKSLAADNRGSLVIDYEDMANDGGEQIICYFLPEAPSQILGCMNRAVSHIVHSLFEHYSRVTPEIQVRIRGLPVEEDIRMLRQIHLNMLIRTSGVVTVTTGMLPQLSVIKFDCQSCGCLIGPYVQRENEECKPTTCPVCKTRGPFELNMENTIYHSYQRIIIQESPNTVAAGRLPRSKDLILTGDLCDSCKPGDEIEVTGIYTNNYDGSLNSKHGFPVFNTVIHANFIRKKDKIASDSLTDVDIKAIKELSQDPSIAQRIFASIAPSIYGHENVKRAIALALFRGEQKNPGEKHNIRGDINILLCGDPGTAKSQFLRYAAHTAPRAVLTTGQGASAVGLTAYVQRHPVTREWTLEAGAMVLADKGVCLIDEFDKMNDQDRTSIHEAMEQQSISISKAGIVTSLQARCTVLAASNPIGGRYDPTRTFAENVDLTEPILSRFDVLCVIRDIVDPTEDDRLATFVVDSHSRNHPDTIAELQRTASQNQMDNAVEISKFLIPQSMLKKYLIYARENIHPRLEKFPQERISKLFAEMRRQSILTGSVAVTVRHVESMIRLSEAHAKLHLRSYVIDEDVDLAMRIMLESFISTQKASTMRVMRKNFSRYLDHYRDNNELLLFLLKQLMREQIYYEQMRHRRLGIPFSTVSIPESELLEKARQVRVENVHDFYKSDYFLKNDFKYDASKKIITQEIFQ